MADEVNGAEQIVEQEQKAVETVDVDSLVRSKMEELNKAWQSRFDKVLQEKKETEAKKMTVEERMAAIEAERRAEKVDWMRKEVKLSAGLDDELHNAFFDYASEDSERMKNGASKIKAILDARETEYKSKIEELEKKLRYGAKPPIGGEAMAKSLESEYLEAQKNNDGAAMLRIKAQMQRAKYKE